VLAGVEHPFAIVPTGILLAMSRPVSTPALGAIAVDWVRGLSG
jgi:hypothetical protein